MLEIAALHGLDAEGLAPFSTGSDAVWGGRGWVVKLTAPVWREQIERESACLELLEGALSVATPACLGSGELAGWPYLIMGRLEGTPLSDVWPRLAHDERLRLAGDLGRLTRELHAQRLGEPEAHWSDFWRDCRQRAPERHRRPGLPAALLAAIGPFLESQGDFDPGARAFLHTEILDQHLLVRTRAGRPELCGLFDFAESRDGAPEYDFTAPVEFLFRGERGLLPRYLTAYGVEPSELGPARSERMLAWSLAHLYGSLERMLELVAPASPSTLPDLARLLYGLEA